MIETDSGLGRMKEFARHNPRWPQKRTDINGILLVDKNEGETSYSIVRKARRTFGLKKVGHAGTLDPFATGLIIILLGQGTKLSPYLMAGRKLYRATLCLGAETDTMDLTGRIISTSPVSDFRPEEIRTAARGFLGEIEQVPPIFSAVNINGTRAYVLARKGIEVKLKKKKVKIHSLEIISIDLPFITVDIMCSGGTYVRSLASDLGKKLGTGAYLKSLRRLKSGSFKVEDTIDSRLLEGHYPKEHIQDRIISLKNALPDMREIFIGVDFAKKIRNGRKPVWKEIFPNSLSDIYNDHIKLVEGGRLVAVVEMAHTNRPDRGWFKKMRVFN